MHRRLPVQSFRRMRIPRHGPHRVENIRANLIRQPHQVAQTLVGYKNLKKSLPSDVDVGRAFHGEFRYNTPRNIRQTLPQTTTGTHPTCLHGTHSRPICHLFKSARIAAASSSDKAITLQLAVPAPRRCPSYILLRCPGPR